jgi:nitrogen PTS system EIIA component
MRHRSAESGSHPLPRPRGRVYELRSMPSPLRGAPLREPRRPSRPEGSDGASQPLVTTHSGQVRPAPLPFSLGVDPPGTTIGERVAPQAVAARRSMGDKDRLFTELAALVAHAVPSVSAAEIEHELRERESLFTTAMGHGVAIPHATVAGVPRTFMGVMTLTQPIDFGQDADGPVDVCFCLVGPPSDRAGHLHLLAQIAGAVTESDLLARLRAARTQGALLDALGSARAANLES